MTIFLFPLPPPLGLGLMSMAPQTPPPTPAPPAKHSPPSAEELCLKTFCACWFIDKDWLVSFIVSAQRLKPDAPITWVEFVPKGHTHLVCCALKLVPPTRTLPLAKVKECMFLFILEVLNSPGSSPGFFTTRKAGKPRKRTRTHKGKGSKSIDMAVDAPNPGTAAAVSTREPEAPTPSGAGDGDPPPLEGSREPRAYTQHFPGPSSEGSRDGGSSSEDPRTSCSSTPTPPALVAPVPSVALALSTHMRQLMQARESKAQKQFKRASLRSLAPAPSITSILGKCSPFPPPPLSPLPELGSPVVDAALDWHAWMQHKRATYLQNNPGKSAPEKVTPLDLYDAASPLSPLSHLTHLTGLRSPSPLSLPSRMSLESEERTPTLHAVGRPP